MIRVVKDVFCKGKPKIMYVIIMAALGVMIEISASFLLSLILDMIPGASENYIQSINGLLDMTPQMIFSVCLLAPILEELIFRGLVYGVASRFMPIIFANIIQALLFGIYHRNLVQGIYAFILGMFIGYLMNLAGGLLYTVIFHASLNAAGLFLIRIIEEEASYQRQMVLAECSLTLIIVIIWILSRKKSNN